jgi:hypothetical protein
LVLVFPRLTQLFRRPKLLPELGRDFGDAGDSWIWDPAGEMPLPLAVATSFLQISTREVRRVAATTLISEVVIVFFVYI